METAADAATPPVPGAIPFHYTAGVYRWGSAVGSVVHRYQQTQAGIPHCEAGRATAIEVPPLPILGLPQQPVALQGAL